MDDKLYECKTCNQVYKRKDTYNKHLLTKKHINAISGILNEIPTYTCDKCGKIYKHKSSLSKHNSKCIYNTKIVPKEVQSKQLEKMFYTMIEENNELKIGVCGEHAGEAESIKFFNTLEIDYISCSPFRIPTAKLAAAQAQIIQSN